MNCARSTQRCAWSSACDEHPARVAADKRRLIGRICDPCVACDDEQVDDSLPPRDTVGSDEVRAPFTKPFRQGEGQGAVLAGAGDDALHPTQALLDLVGDVEFADGDDELVDAHARARNRREPAVDLRRPCQQAPPAVGLSCELDREGTPPAVLGINAAST